MDFSAEGQEKRLGCVLRNNKEIGGVGVRQRCVEGCRLGQPISRAKEGPGQWVLHQYGGKPGDDTFVEENDDVISILKRTFWL